MSLLNANNLKAAALSSSERQRKYSTDGVLLSPDGSVATDGRALVWVSAPDDGIKAKDFPSAGHGKVMDSWRPFVLPSAVAADVLKQLSQRPHFPILNRVGITQDGTAAAGGNGAASSAVVLTTDLKRVNPTIVPKPSSNFPDWRSLVPDEDDAALTMCVNARVMADVFSLIADMQGTTRDMANPPETIVRIYGKDRAVRVDAKLFGGGNRLIESAEGQKVIALAMPASLENMPESTEAILRRLRGAGKKKSTGLIAAARERLEKLRSQVREMRLLLDGGEHA